jgi:hypothetical protein
MKYYEQLLESFNKLKKRTFKLTVLEDSVARSQLPEFQTALSSAKDALTNFAKAGTGTLGDTNVQPTLTKDGRVNVPRVGTFTSTGDGGWKDKSGRDIDFNAAQSQSNSGMLVALFMSKDEKPPTTGQQVPGQVPGQAAGPQTGVVGVVPQVPAMPYIPGQAAEEAGFTDPELVGFMNTPAGPLPTNLFQDMRDKASKLCDKLSEMGIDKSCNHFLNFFGGNASQSPEKAFAPNRRKYSYDEEFKVLTRSKLDEQESKEALKSLDWLLDQLNSDIPIDGIELRRRFAVANNGSVLITIGPDGGDGYITKDTPGVYKALLNAAIEKVDPTSVPGAMWGTSLPYVRPEVIASKEFELHTFTPRVSSGAAKGIRGKMLEEVYMLRILAKHCAANRTQGQELTTPACVMFKAASERFQKHKENWPMIHEWAAEHDLGAAIKQDDAGLYEVVKASGIQGENLVKIVGAMFALSEKIDDAIGATMSVPVGLSPGEGEKPDVTYVWNTVEEAQAGLKNLGFTEDDIATGMIKQGTIGEAFKGSAIPDLEQYYRDNHDPDGTDLTFYHGTGLKHFEGGGTHSMHAGVRQHGSLTKTMAEGTQMRIRAAQYFGHSTQEAKAVDTYFADKVNGILENVTAGVTLQNVPDPTNSKKKVKKDPLLDLINSHLDAANKNSDYYELRHDGLKHFMEKYIDSNGRWTNKKQNPEEREHIAEAISRQLMWRRINTDLHSEDSATKKTALNYLATSTFITGGAHDDTTSTSVRDLASFRHMSIVHNEGMNFVRNAVNNKGGIEIIHPTGAGTDEFGEGNSVKFRDNNNHDSYVTLRLTKDKGEPKWSVEYSSGFLIAHDRLKGTQPSLQAASTRYGDIENMIQEYLDNQKDMLIKILSS